MAKQTQPGAPTFSLAALQEIINTPEGKALLSGLVQEQAKQASTMDMDKIVVRAFAKAGFGTVVPRVDTMTYGRWIAAGYRVKPGEHAVKCKNLRLFHRSQTEAISAKEKTAILAEKAAKQAAKTSDRLPPVSPVPPITAAKPAKSKSAAAQPAA